MSSLPDPSSTSSANPAFDPERPFNELPPLPPPTQLETVAVLKAIIPARERLAELNTACRLIPNPRIITATVPLREAQASSEIENIVTTNDELFRAAWRIDAEPTPHTKEALRYNEALHVAISELDRLPVSARLAQKVCSTLQSGSAEIRAQPGTFIGNPVTGQRIYTPPEGERVILDHLSAWERFIYTASDIDPLVLMAITHYQFEAIHPFYDGNGRTGRILNVALLIQEQILNLPILYLSGYIVSHKKDYYRLLRAVTSEGAWEEWILFMVQAVKESTEAAIALINSVQNVKEELERQIKNTTRIAPAKEVAELLVINPYVRIANVVDAGLASRQTAASWLNQLADEGVLAVEKVGREKIFVNRRVLTVLTAP